jgi:hypothetical protein
MKRFVTTLAAAAAFTLGTTPHPTAQTAPAHQPRLVVVIAVDQMRGDYPERYNSILT